jgi:predicted ATP-dependent serine protease
MARQGLQQEGILRLLGRDPERAAIDRLLDDARAGVGGALIVRGEPGIGKSALLDYARQRATPMAVLSAAGVEAASAIAGGIASCPRA